MDLNRICEHHIPLDPLACSLRGTKLLPKTEPGLTDDRYKTLLGLRAWQRLPAPLKKRFSKRLRQGDSVVYRGIIKEMEMNLPGYLLAQFTRLLGAPLPFDQSSCGQAAVVIVTEDQSTNGQFWIRQYGRMNNFPQLVHSSKRFSGPTGLEEYIGYGIGMALRIEATEHALFFKSDHYFAELFGLRLKIPQWLSPGALTIGHHEKGNDEFTFTLSLKNKLFGTLITQTALFKDAKE